MPSDVNIGVFAFLTGELGLLSFIKRSKITAEALQPQIQQIQTMQQINNNEDKIGAMG